MFFELTHQIESLRFKSHPLADGKTEICGNGWDMLALQLSEEAAIAYSTNGNGVFLGRTVCINTVSARVPSQMIPKKKTQQISI